LNVPPVDLSLIIPCYNEGPYLSDSVRQIRQTLESCSWSYELIFIDDRSRDGTPDVIKQLTDDQVGCEALYHRQNVGRGGTVTEGLRHAKGEVAGFIDIDLEVHCRYIPSMVQAILMDGYDIATAYRIYRVKFTPGGILRWILSVGYRRLIRLLLGSHFNDTEAGFKFFRREAILPVLDRCRDKGWFWDTEVMLESRGAGLKAIEIPALFIRRTDKTSSLRILPDTIAYLKAIWRYKRRHKD